MQNEARWQPSKFEFTPRGFRASRNRKAIGVSSRLPADISARWYERVVPEHARGHLVDLGCGTVPLYGLYGSHIDSVTCIDWSNSIHAINHVDIEHDLTKPLPLADCCCDTIVISSVIEHLPEPEMIWTEMARVLTPGGKVILYVPFLYWLHEVPNDFYRYTEFALRRFAERAGLEIVELTPTGGAAEVATDVICKALGLIRGGKAAAQVLQWICNRFSSTRFGRSFRERTARKTPLAYGVILRKPSAGP